MEQYRAGTQEMDLGLRSWRGRVVMRVTPDKDESNVIWIDSVVSKTPQKGHGTAAMNWLIDLADETGVTLRLDAVPIGNRKMPEADLFRFYRRFGFRQPYGDSGMERKSLAAVVPYRSLYRAIRQGVGDVVDPRWPSVDFDLPDFNTIYRSEYPGLP
jgi:hypothetical protein